MQKIRYAQAARTKRLEAVRDLIDAAGVPGRIELLGSNGLVSAATLAFPCATVEGDVLEFSGMPIITGPAQVEGELKFGHILDGDGNEVISHWPALVEGLASRKLNYGEGRLFRFLRITHP